MTCGGGFQTSYRVILEEAQNGGASCEGDSTRDHPCNTMGAKWTASGHTGHHGDLAQQHVAEELRHPQDQSGKRRNMAEEIA